VVAGSIDLQDFLKLVSSCNTQQPVFIRARLTGLSRADCYCARQWVFDRAPASWVGSRYANLASGAVFEGLFGVTGKRASILKVFSHQNGRRLRLDRQFMSWRGIWLAVGVQRQIWSGQAISLLRRRASRGLGE
jgi:hypothetical protein